MYLFQLYHQISKKKNDESVIFKPVSLWPAAWTTVTLKCYERFPLLSLPSPARDLEPLLSTTLRTRRSRRNFDNSLDVQLISNL